MKKIHGYYHFNSSDSNEFAKALEDSINKLQDDGQEVEVQYKVNISDKIKGYMVYSALVIGRK